MELLDFKVNGGTATHTYWKSKVDSFLCHRKNDEEVMAIRSTWMNMSGKVNSIMTEYLKLIDYPENFFQCCLNPKVLCTDGIVLSVESKRIQNRGLVEPWRDFTARNQRFRKRRERDVITFDKNDKAIWKMFISNGKPFI